MLWVLGNRMFTERGGCDRLVEFCMENVEETEGGRVVESVISSLLWFSYTCWSILMYERCYIKDAWVVVSMQALSVNAANDLQRIIYSVSKSTLGCDLVLLVILVMSSLGGGLSTSSSTGWEEAQAVSS